KNRRNDEADAPWTGASVFSPDSNDVIDHKRHEPDRDTEPGPFAARDPELAGGYDVWDVSGNQHSSADEEAEQDRPDGIKLHERTDFGGSQRGIIENC